MDQARTMDDEARLEGFLAKYTPDIADQLRAARQQLAQHFPRGFELVYDNYNALVIAYASSEKSSDVIVSLAAYPRWVTLFFWRGVDLPDPAHLLEGRGAQIRSVRLQPATPLQDPAVQALIDAARSMAAESLAVAPPRRLVVKSVSARQRGRQPAVLAKKAVSKKAAAKKPASRRKPQPA